jgi:hypothetical protein
MREEILPLSLSLEKLVAQISTLSQPCSKILDGILGPLLYRRACIHKVSKNKHKEGSNGSNKGSRHSRDRYIEEEF